MTRRATPPHLFLFHPRPLPSAACPALPVFISYPQERASADYHRSFRVVAQEGGGLTSTQLGQLRRIRAWRAERGQRAAQRKQQLEQLQALKAGGGAATGGRAGAAAFGAAALLTGGH